MKLGLIGLGKMGKNLAAHLLEQNHKVVVYNRSADAYADPELVKAVKTQSLKEMVNNLKGKRIVWLMVTAGAAIDDILFSKTGLMKLMDSGDIIIDGGNSKYTDTLRRGEILAKKKIHYIDAGVSGGPTGARYGASIMVGGDEKVITKLEPLFESLAVKGGYVHVGPLGSGHLVKMIHNGIEYAWMQALGEGLELVLRGPIKGINLNKTLQAWQNGSVIESKLVTLAARALKKNPNLKGVLDYVADNGEGRWTVQTAIDAGVPMNTIATAVFARLYTQQEHGEKAPHSFAAKVLAALRNEFGGHEIKKS